MRTRLATTSHTSHAASSASLTLPHRAKAAISETMDIAGTSFPARRYSSDTRWGRNSADRAESGAGSVAKFVFCVWERTVQFWHGLAGARESRYTFALVERDRCKPVPLCTSGRQK